MIMHIVFWSNVKVQKSGQTLKTYRTQSTEPLELKIKISATTTY